MRYGVLILAVLVVACNGATGNVVADEKSFFEEQIASLEAALDSKDSLIAQKDALVADAKTLVASLEEELAAKQALVNQQKVVLKELDDERLEAVNAAEGCDERIDELEMSNEKLQKMLDICQEDLS